MPLHKGNSSKDECNNYRGINLISLTGKMYGRVLTDRLMKITKGKVCEEQGGFWKGNNCMDQIFAIKMVVEEYTGKGKNFIQLSWKMSL